MIVKLGKRDILRKKIKKPSENSDGFLEAPPRFELGVKALQASALPLGYGAMNAAFRRILNWSGRRDSNSRHSPWQGDALPLSHSRICLYNLSDFMKKRKHFARLFQIFSEKRSKCSFLALRRCQAGKREKAAENSRLRSVVFLLQRPIERVV